MIRRLFALLLALLLVFSTCALSEGEETPAIAAESIPEINAAADVTPTPTPVPEATPTAEPVATPMPEATPTAEPAATPMPEATLTAEPAATSVPEATPTAEPAPEPTAEPALTVSETSVTLGQGESFQLSAAYASGEPAAATFSSRKPRIASVSASGIIKGARVGTTEIVAATAGGQSAIVTVIVKKAPSRVSLDVKKLTLGEDEACRLEVSLPKNTASRLSFTSSDPEVLEVDESGLLHALKLGSANITVRTFNGKKASCAVTVLNAPENLVLNADALTLGEGDSFALSATTNEGSAGAYSLVADSGHVVIDENGKLTALTAGDATVTATTYNGKTAVCRVHVVDAPTQITLATPDGRTDYGVKEQMQLVWRLDNNVGNIQFSSSNGRIAAVSESGLVTFLRSGKVTIKATAYNGISSSITLNSRSEPKSVSLNALRTKLGLGETAELSASLSKNSAGSYAFSSSAPEIISVSGTTAAALQTGSAVLTVTTYNGKKASKTVTVYPMPETVSLNANELTLGAGECFTLSAALNEGSAGAYSFESADPAVAAVEAATGRITAVAPGQTHITVRCYNGVSARCGVTVKGVPEGISISENSLNLSQGDSYQLSAPVLQGENVFSNTITYKSSRPNVVSVSASGLLTAKRTGKCEITITTYNKKTAALQISVSKAPKSISISPNAVTLCIDETFQPSVKLNTGALGSYALSSSDEQIAVITDDGRGVYAVSSGTTEITATSYNGKKAAMTVTVLPLPTEIALTPAEARVGAGEALQLRAVMPDGQGSHLRYESADPDVATADASGRVQTHGAGMAHIRVYTQSDLCAESVIHVLRAPAWLRVFPESASYRIDEGGFTLQPVFPSAEEGGSVFYESADPSLATVSDAGEVRFLNTGTVKIMARSYNGRTAACTLTIGETPQEIRFSQDSYTVAAGDCISIPAEFTQGAESYHLETADTNIAIASGNQVTGIAVGETLLTAVSSSRLRAECTLRVVAPPEGLVTEQTEITLVLGKVTAFALTAHPLPEDAGTLRYSSSDPTIADVDALTGIVVPHKIGDCDITITTYDGRFTETCAVHVDGLLKGVKIGIDPGHQLYYDNSREPSAPSGGKMKAKVAVGGRGKVSKTQEYVINLQVGLRMREELEMLGAEVKMTRTTHDVNISNKQRALMMNDFGADLVLRLHCNAWKSSKPNGISMMVSKSWAQPEESLRAAELLMSRMLEATGASDRGISLTDYYTGNNWSTVPCILVEMGFLTNVREDQLLNSAEYQEILSHSMIDAICDYMGRERPTIW